MKSPKKKNDHGKAFGVGFRLSEAPANEMIEYASKKRLDEAKYIFGHELWNHKAHTLMLHEQGIVTRRDASKILKVLDEIESMGLKRFPLDPRKGELFFNTEAYLIEKIGEDPGGRMHSGRSRGDMYVCSERMVLREKILQLVDDILALIETIIPLAGQNLETVMPGYTLLQHAQPTTFAHYVLSFADRFQRDLDRLQETYRRVNRSSMGGAIVTGSSFPLNRPRMAELLGFDGVVENTRDASIARDFTLESTTHAAIALSNLSALADDLNVWCTYEFGMIELSDAYCGTSSIMPQKKNPSSLERIRYLYAQGMGNTMTVFSQLKTHSEQLGDLEATGPVAWQTYETAQAAFRVMKGILSTLKIRKEIMRERAGANFAQATQLAETIVQEKNLPFRTAHHIVGKLVKSCIEEKISPAQVTSELLDEAAIEVIGRPLRMNPRTISSRMDAGYIIEHRNILGGPGRRQVSRMLKKQSVQIQKKREWLAHQQKALKSAKDSVDAAARKMMAR